jgi:hypothetical protein
VVLVVYWTAVPDGGTAALIAGLLSLALMSRLLRS